ncbi:MAG: hypothetical protein HY958_13845 [Bacteroidia bacterium]|nr:hypothetical protein [Bacteroidia bacterium]
MDNADLEKKIAEIAEVTKKELTDIALNEQSLVSRNVKDDKFEDLLEKFYEAQTVFYRTKEKLVDRGKLAIEVLEDEIAELENKEVYLEKLKEIVVKDILSIVRQTVSARLQ